MAKQASLKPTSLPTPAKATDERLNCLLKSFQSINHIYPCALKIGRVPTISPLKSLKTVLE